MAGPDTLLFMGSKAAGLGACRRLADLLPEGRLAAIVCPDDRSDSRTMFGAFEDLARERGLPFHMAASRQEAETIVRRIAPDTAIVHGWYQILPVDELRPTRFLGFHYSPLPRYRGNAPLVWQILSGEREIGVSFFELTAEMDSGRLADQRSFALGHDETVADALDRADAVVDEMLAAFVPAWLAGEVELRPQPEGEPSYCALRQPDDGRIDWRWSGDRIHDFIRAQCAPYPGAFTLLPDGRRLIVQRSAREDRRFLGAPGAVAEIGEDHVVVAAGEGSVRLLRVQLDGEEERPARDVLRSLKTRLG